jgi:plasmid maintenance system killer protein
VIVSYRDKATKDFAAGKRLKAFFGIVLRDAAALPGNRFEELRGDRKGQSSIRIKTGGGFVLNGLEQHPAR